ncbi:MAG: hypothetical protein UU47_C0009G0010 [candidate division TM6 bacterium GW2011_GWE2_41_16]|nr:MAG: hypothetical protein UU47_C0009G0010 [candidate division TM6 bacterium GW2011_GWE2_41_16]
MYIKNKRILFLLLLVSGKQVLAQDKIAFISQKSLSKDELAYVPKNIKENIEYIKSNNTIVARKYDRSRHATILLTGKAGSGKKTCARYIAHEFNAAFFSISNIDLQEISNIDLQKKRVDSVGREIAILFNKARAYSKRTGKQAVVFVDGIDFIGKSFAGTSDEQLLSRGNGYNSLFAQLDGSYHDNSNIIFIGATNDAGFDAIDRELLCHLSCRMKLELPTKSECADLIKFYFKNVNHNLSDRDISYLVRYCSSTCTPADIITIVNQSIVCAQRKNKKNIERADVVEAFKIVRSQQKK